MGTVAEHAAFDLVLLATADIALLVGAFVSELEGLVLTALLGVRAVAERLVLRLAASAVIVSLALLQEHLHRLLLSDLGRLAVTQLLSARHVGQTLLLRVLLGSFGLLRVLRLLSGLGLLGRLFLWRLNLRGLFLVLNNIIKFLLFVRGLLDVALLVFPGLSLVLGPPLFELLHELLNLLDALVARLHAQLVLARR